VVDEELIILRAEYLAQVADRVVVDQAGMVVRKRGTLELQEQQEKAIQADLEYTITAHQQVHTTVVVVAEVLALMDIIDILDTIKPAEAKESQLISAEL
jgi:hypothetical protein